MTLIVFEGLDQSGKQTQAELLRDRLKQDGLKLRAGGYRMQDMIRYVVNSKAFLEK